MNKIIILIILLIGINTRVFLENYENKTRKDLNITESIIIGNKKNSTTIKDLNETKYKINDTIFKNECKILNKEKFFNTYIIIKNNSQNEFKEKDIETLFKEINQNVITFEIFNEILKFTYNVSKNCNTTYIKQLTCINNYYEIFLSHITVGINTIELKEILSDLNNTYETSLLLLITRLMNAFIKSVSTKGESCHYGITRELCLIGAFFFDFDESYCDDY